MTEKFKHKSFDVVIDRKNNKNSYVRISNDMEVVITTSLYSKRNDLLDLIDRNEKKINGLLEKQKKEKLLNYYYRGMKCERILIPQLKKVEVSNNKILYPNEIIFDKWYKSEIQLYFKDLLYECYNKFDEKIFYPQLKIRKMKTRWGVCHKAKKIITLNSELVNFSNSVIKYVIIHELCHLVHLNHSEKFWQLVAKYCPDYKKIKKILRD